MDARLAAEPEPARLAAPHATGDDILRQRSDQILTPQREHPIIIFLTATKEAPNVVVQSRFCTLPFRDGRPV